VRYVNLVLEERPGEGGYPGWLLECLIFGIAIEDVVEGPNGRELSGAALSNVAQGVDSRFLEGDESVTPALTCSLGGPRQGLIVSVGAGVMRAERGGTLSVSG
jgi:hypothetical protein